MNKLFLTIYFIINPKWWIMVNKYDKDWDKKINELLDKHKFEAPEYDNGLSYKLGNHHIWLGSYPFSYGLQNRAYHVGDRPSRYTIWKIRKRVKLDLMSKEDKRDLKLNKLLK